MHMIPTELKNIEMKLDREKLEEQKNLEQYVKNKLDRMQPCIQYNYPLGKFRIKNLRARIAELRQMGFKEIKIPVIN